MAEFRSEAHSSPHPHPGKELPLLSNPVGVGLERQQDPQSQEWGRDEFRQQWVQFFRRPCFQEQPQWLPPDKCNFANEGKTLEYFEKGVPSEIRLSFNPHNSYDGLLLPLFYR